MARDFKVKAVITAEDKASGPIRRAQGSLSSFTGFLRNSFVITAGDVFRATQAAFETMRESINLQAQERALASQLASVGQSFDGFIGKLKEVSDGTVATADLIDSSSRALLLGIPADEIADLLEIARASAVATGETTAKAFDDITTGIGRASPLILDNLGLVVKLETAYAEMASELGKSAEALTDSEKRQALLNQVLRVGKTRVEEFGDAAEGMKSKLEASEAAVENLGDAVGKVVTAFGEGITSGASFGDEAESLTAAIEGSASAFQTAGTFLSLYLGELASGRPVYSAVAEAAAKLDEATRAGNEANEASVIAQQAANVQKQAAKQKTEALKIATEQEAIAHEKLTTALQNEADAYENAISAANSFGEVTSVQLAVQISEIALQLELQKDLLGANSDEFVRLEEVARTKIASLEDRIRSLRDGHGDLNETIEDTSRAYQEFGRSASTAADSVVALTRATREQAVSVQEAQRASSASSFNPRGQLGGNGGLFPGLSGGVFTVRVRNPTVSPSGRVVVNP